MNALTNIPAPDLDLPKPFKMRLSHQGRKLSVYVLRPGTLSGRRPLIALHGISRNAKALLRQFGPEAQRTGRIIVVPHFSQKDWPFFQRPTRKTRPDRALLAVMDALAAVHPGFDGPVDLFGFSGGAQLAHRTAMLYPHRFGDLHLGSAGWYCLPNETAPYPYGLGHSETGRSDWAHCKREMLPEFLNRKITVYIGDRDIERDEALRQNDILDRAQGLTRLSRARSYVRSLTTAAQAHGRAVQAELIEMPGARHDFEECALHADLAHRVAG